jgi:hypothetical protein
MRKSLDLFERRVNTLETVFAELGTATILYDLFGRVLLVNRRMVEVTREAGLAPYEMTALDLVMTLCGLSIEEIREHLHNVLIEHDEIALSTSRFLGVGSEYVLRIRPLIQSDQNLPAEDAHPFSIYGILIELVDLREITHHERLKEQITGKLSVRLSELLEPIVAATELLGKEPQDAETRRALVGDLRRNASKTLLAVKNISRSIEEDLTGSGKSVYPVDGVHLLKHSAGLADHKLLQRRITTTVVASDTVPMVWAAPRALEVAFRSLLVILGNDAALNSTIRIDVTEEDDFIAYRLVSKGFGMSADVLHRNLFSDEPTDSVLLRRARTAVRHIEQWRGSVEASSTIGEGTSIIIRLRKFILEQGSLSGSHERLHS